jgi:serine O-acetyltransferase
MFDPVRLWRLSAALHRRGHRRLALLVKHFTFLLYHNSLAPEAQFSPDIRFGHHGFGTVIHSNVVIGKRVWIWHNVTIAVRAGHKDPQRIIIEDDVKIGANSVIISSAGRSLRIGRGARIGAGALVVRDVPPGATVVSAPARVVESPQGAEGSDPAGSGPAGEDPADDPWEHLGPEQPPSRTVSERDADMPAGEP